MGVAVGVSLGGGVLVWDNRPVAKGFRPVDRDQLFVLPPDMRDWLPERHPVWLVIEIVSGHLDLAPLRALRKTGGAGRAAYDPAMLLTVVVWAWMHEKLSSRRIERACHSDVAFRIACAGEVPDHTTISRFVKDSYQVCQALFEQVLQLCGRLDLVRLDLIALDGTKIAANASTCANRTEEGLVKAAKAAAARAAAGHLAADEADDERYGPDDNGFDLPDDLVDPRSRAGRIKRALEDLAREKAAAAGRDAAGRYDAAVAAGQVRTGVPPTERRVAAARANLERVVADQQRKLDHVTTEAAAGRGVGGRPVKPVAESRKARKALARLADAEAAARSAVKAAAKKANPVRNITDPDSRLQPTRRGWIQGYNCQAFTDSSGVILATDVSENPSDVAAFEPMLDRVCTAVARLLKLPAATHAQAREHAASRVGTMLFDAGYLSRTNLTSPGPDRLIATGKRRDLETAAHATTENPAAVEPSTPSPPTDPIAAMARRLRTDQGISTYRQRGPIAETVFGHTKHNRGFRQFRSRGLDNVTAEWTLQAAIHNLGKIVTHLTNAQAGLPTH